MVPLSIPFKVFGLCVQNHLFAILSIATGKKMSMQKDQAGSFALFLFLHILIEEKIAISNDCVFLSPQISPVLKCNNMRCPHGKTNKVACTC